MGQDLFFLQGNNNKQKYRLAKWNILRRPKDQGGLGIPDLWIRKTWVHPFPPIREDRTNPLRNMRGRME